MIPVSKICPCCGAVFYQRDGEKLSLWLKRKYCSRSCADIGRVRSLTKVDNLPEQKNCEYCSNKFSRQGRSAIAWERMKFCSLSCANKARCATRKITSKSNKDSPRKRNVTISLESYCPYYATIKINSPECFGNQAKGKLCCPDCRARKETCKSVLIIAGHDPALSRVE